MDPDHCHGGIQRTDRDLHCKGVEKVKVNVGFIAGDNIRKRREERGIEQTALAEQLLVSQPTLSMFEKGLRPVPLRVAAEAAKIFGCSIDALVQEE